MSTEIDYSETEHAGFEQRLRRELEQVTVRVPADMIPRAHRGYRRRLVTTRISAITGGAAVIAGAATIVAMTGSSPGVAQGGQRPGATTSQAAASRIPAASTLPPPPGDGLTSAQAGHEISWVRTSLTSPAGATSVSDTFSYGPTSRTLGFSEKGTALYDEQETLVTGAGGSQAYATTSVSYAGGTVSRGTTPGPAQHRQPALCPQTRQFGLSLIRTSTLIASAAALLACPGVTVTRGVRIDGIKAVTISTVAIHVRTTDWLNAATGMPIQTTIVPYDPNLPNTIYTTRIQYGFLPPTAANLRYLSTYVPPGFRNLPSPTSSVPPGFKDRSSASASDRPR